MTGSMFILFIPIVFVIMALKISGTSKHTYQKGDGGCSGPFDRGYDYADSISSGFVDVGGE